MSLYKATVGSAPQASDVNQLIDIFQGLHDIGNVTFATAIATPGTTGISTSTSASTSLGIGTYNYVFTQITGYYKSDGTLTKTGETLQSAVVTATTTSGNQAVNITLPTTSLPTSGVAWGIYRGGVGGTDYKQIATVKFGTSSYADSTADIARSTTGPPSSNSTGMAFNFGGTVAAPNNIYSSAVGVASQSMPASTDTGITLSPAGLGLAGDSNWSTSTWTCPVAGIYMVNMNAYFTPAASSLFQVKLFVNGTLDQYLISDYISSAQSICRAGMALKKLNVGDTLRFYANAGATAGTFNGNYSRVVIVKIG